jgi:dTDP-4-amino-4,6-dideoxygalactose transaminase
MTRPNPDHPKVPHSRPAIGEEEIEAVSNVMRSGKLAQGPEVEAFEQECADCVGRRYAVALSSGTAALHLTLAGLGVDSEGHVAVPDYACAALITATDMARATSHLCDVGRDYLMPADAPPPECDAAIAVHLFGATCALPSSLPVIEDIAQSIGGKTGNGSIAAVASFYATKLLTTGEGGMVLTDDEGLAEFARDHRDYDNRDDLQRRFPYKMTDIQAAMGRVQLRKLPGFLERRRAIAEDYTHGLHGLPLRFPPSENHIFFRYVVGTDRRSELERYLQSQSIEAKRPVYMPSHHYVSDEPASPRLAMQGSYPGAEQAHNEALSIPIHPEMVEHEIEWVIESINRFFN